MSGMLSLRVSKQERRQLQQLKAERGHKTLSETMRTLMGFPATDGSGETLMAGSDDIDSVDRLCTLVVAMIDRLDDQNKTLTMIARHVGVPRELSAGAVAASIANRTPLHPLPDLDKPLEQANTPRNGHKHPELPEGFSRG